MRDFIKNKDQEQALQAMAPQQQFSALLTTAASKNFPLAAWRLPGKKSPSLLVDLNGAADRVYPDLEDIPAGFLFAPYATDLMAADAAENPQCRFLNADLLWDGEEEGFRLSAGLTPAQEQRAEILFREAVRLTADKGSWPLGAGAAKSTPKAEYLKLVQDSVEAIRRGDFQKNVCARSSVVALPEGFGLERFFRALCSAYPNAFVSLVAVPGEGTWIGATPEVLISVNKNQQFCTVALAGTQPRQQEMAPADAVWRQKEIEEQAMVSRYIINCFKKIRLREFEEVGPRTIAAANLLHLRTDFTVDLKEAGYPSLPTEMLRLLHPTSAVCGLPKAPAAAFLEQHEALDRSFFAGFLGPVNLKEETRLFVNLRCMQLFADSAMLYAGAGITADSVPEREWEETEHKCQTLLEILQKV